MSPCGGENQRACCVSEGAACNDGLEKIPGCTGDCFCEGSTSGRTPASSSRAEAQADRRSPDTGRATAPAEARTCKRSAGTPTSTSTCSRTPRTAAASVGRRVAIPPTTTSTSLSALTTELHRDLVTKTGGEPPTPTCPSWISDCGEKLFHGDHFPLVDDAVGGRHGRRHGLAARCAGVQRMGPPGTTTTHPTGLLQSGSSARIRAVSA